MTKERSRAVEDILDELENAAGKGDEVSIGDALEALGSRGYGPLLFVPALIEISPIGGIPGVPTMLALIIVLFAAQIAWGREHIWLPGFLERMSVSGDRMSGAVDKMRPVGKWLDRWFHGRLPRLTGKPAMRAAAGLTILLCLSVPPLELIPFASTAPMAAIAAFGLAITLRDGVLMVLGILFTAVAVGVGFGFLGGS